MLNAPQVNGYKAYASKDEAYGLVLDNGGRD